MPDEAYRGRYAKASASISGEGGGEVKGFWREIDHPRDEDGKFSSGGAGVVRAKLHREHGTGKVERTFSHEMLDIGAPEGMRHDEMRQLFVVFPSDNQASLKFDGETARRKLAAMYDEKRFGGLRDAYNKLDDEKYRLTDSLKDVFTPPSEEEKVQWNQQIADIEKQMEGLSRQMLLENSQRYSEMWTILLANDKPAFKIADFDVDQTLDHSDRESIEIGVHFLSRIAGIAVPDTKALKFREAKTNRARYVYGKNKLGVETNSVVLPDSSYVGPNSVVHEMAHWLHFHDKDLNEKLRLHYEQRTKGEAAQELSLLDRKGAYEKGEKSKPDEFIHPYMGKYYPGTDYNEILSIGLEYFLYKPDVLAKNDPKTFNFIYGLMRGE